MAINERPKTAIENALDMVFHGPAVVNALAEQREELLAVLRRIGSGAEPDPAGAAQRVLYEMNDTTFSD